VGSTEDSSYADRLVVVAPARSRQSGRAQAGETVDPMASSETAARVSLSTHLHARHTAVDGAWWPRSTDLAGELPALVAALDERGLRISRIAYSLSAWDPTPHRVQVDGRTVRTGGFRVIDPTLVSLTSAGGVGEPVDLRVLPPDTDPQVAARELAADAAGRPAGPRTVG
jgi:hypothetical protein